MNGLPYYKAYPRDFFEGTVGMDFEVKAAYRLLLDLIYMHGGQLTDDPRFIAGHLGCSVKRWNALRKSMIDGGKVTVSDGYLGNLRADKEIDSLKSMQTKQRENASKPRKNNDIDEPRQSQNQAIQNQNHIEKEEANASSKKSDRGSRLPSGWSLSDEYREAAKAMGASEHLIASEAEKFRDFWIAKPGKDGVKLDWLATWRNWVRTALSNPRNKPADMSEARRRAAAEEADRHRAAVEVGKQNYGKERPAPKPQISEKMRLQVQRDLAEMRAAASQNALW